MTRDTGPLSQFFIILFSPDLTVLAPVSLTTGLVSASALMASPSSVSTWPLPDTRGLPRPSLLLSPWSPASVSSDNMMTTLKEAHYDVSMMDSPADSLEFSLLQSRTLCWTNLVRSARSYLPLQPPQVRKSPPVLEFLVSSETKERKHKC